VCRVNRERSDPYGQSRSEGADINGKHVRAILEYSRARITAKGKKWGIDEVECKRIVALARAFGVASLVFIDGRVCAGALIYRAGHEIFMRVCSHDPAYDDLRLGACAAEEPRLQCARNRSILKSATGPRDHPGLVAAPKLSSAFAHFASRPSTAQGPRHRRQMLHDRGVDRARRAFLTPAMGKATLQISVPNRASTAR
jgi:hypothetical protein